VVVPAILNFKDSIPNLLEHLETCYLTNQNKNLHFAILSDFADSNEETDKNDQKIIDLLGSGIKNLNLKYAKESPDFFLFHRKRLWNPEEKKWMGWERKRGKIQEFNQFLRGDKKTSFIHNPEFSEFFASVKYVITLDTDTILPRYSAQKLIGTILHPLNSPQFDENKKMVVKGYSILQPRVGINPESAEKSPFAKIYSGHTGIDPYTTAVSNVYQDLFREGSYTGKGLYVVDTFEGCLKGRIPNNKILSHDLIEGAFARAALVSDIEFFDDYPSHYGTFAKRHHRWIRGDWQIIQWLFPRVPDEQNRSVPNTLSTLSKWKIFDNLRRSLVAPLFFLWFLIAWLIATHPLAWTLIILTLMLVPIYIRATSKFLTYPKSLSWINHFRALLEDLKMNLDQLLIYILALPVQSALSMNAISKTLYRVFISHKDLLEWRTAAQEESALKKKSAFIKELFVYSSLPSILIIIFIFLKFPGSLLASGIILVAWIVAPLIFEKLSKTKVEKPFKLNMADRDLLQNIAFRTWNFFETFVTEKENYLPPDNFQEDPTPVVANRTSPTNMGLYLLSSCSAYDFGFIGPMELMDRLEQTLTTMSKLDRRFGHFYNWYDTTILKPLAPEYISTVDSGNLAGHLLTVKQMCIELKKEKDLHQNIGEGALCALKMMREKCDKLSPNLLVPKEVNTQPLPVLIDDIILWAENKTPQSDQEWQESIGLALKKIHEIKELVSLLTREHGKHYDLIKVWADKTLQKIENVNKELSLAKSANFFPEFKGRCIQVAKACHNMAMNMNFSILYNKERKLFTIGYRVMDGKRDDSYYDLLASEARLASLFSIAKNDIPEDHWFHLGRQMTSLFHKRVLISWSASMFEYLMPLLIMKDYKGTLLYETHHACVKQQIKYGRLKKRPWGISESAYNARDMQMNYQYGPFGVPGLGLKRGLSHDFVVSPYSTALAALVLPEKALKNFKRLINQGLLTIYGFYEAVDYTTERIPPGENFSVIKNFMAHHQGMTLVSLSNILNQNKMPELFHQDPIIRATELLLQERIPQRVFILHPREEEVLTQSAATLHRIPTQHQVDSVNTDVPNTRVLSNGAYSVVLSSVGSGYSLYENIAVFRWVEDSTLDQFGQYVFIYDEEVDSLWSPTFHPLSKNTSEYQTIHCEHKVEFMCRKKTITSHTEVIVSAKDNVELKRIHLTNLSDKPRTLEITSYGEPTLSTVDTDIAHPAFNKLFIQTEYLEKKSALIAHRSKRAEKDQEYFGIHLVTCNKELDAPIQFETNRAKFLGRGNTLANAQAFKRGQKLSGSEGGVLDPILSLRIKITLAPYETTQLLFVSGIAKSKEEALGLIDHYHDIHCFDQEDQRSWTQSQINIKHLNLNIADINTYQRLAGAIVYANSNVRSRAKFIEANEKSQEALWAYGISGDLPILLIFIKDQFNLALIKDSLRAHEYLRSKNIRFDLVILSEESSTYHQDIHSELLQQVRLFGGEGHINKPGGIFLLKKNITPEGDRNLLRAVAKIYFNSEKGSLKKQVKALLTPKAVEEVEVPSVTPTTYKDIPLPRPEMEFFNSYGGFTGGGKEYAIYLEKDQNTPAPWVNVLGNEKSFGTMVTESGSSYTWASNSRENRITPWFNDPTSDPSGELFYLYDRDSKEYWSPTPNSARDDYPYLIRHGQGYTTFEHNSFEIGQELTLFVSMKDEVKFMRLKLKNHSTSKRSLSVFYYLEWVLGFHRSKTGPHIVTEKDEAIFLARNRFLPDFGNRISFACANRPVTSFTCDRGSFLGRNGNYKRPQGINDFDLDEKIGTGLDSCLAMKLDIDLNPGEEYEVIFLLGQADSKEEIKNLVQNFSKADQVLQNAKDFWNQTQETLQIKTPYPEIDLYVNRWALYQTLSCRIWARTAFYQSGGAYGFRDQLQDMACLMNSLPDLCRSYILRAAAHQFPEGDVLHWWHPPTDKGVRTRFSDDLLWLPFITEYYLQTTGDYSILDEQVSFLEGPLLTDGVDDLYLHAGRTEETADHYTHCCLTIDRSLKVGAHGLPLMGSGDWNDGMSEVGNKGKGESVWMGWFLGSTITKFIPICEKRGDTERVEKYKAHLEKLKEALSTTGWDGKWFRRAYFDDGQPLGSHENDECKIDSIAQSWSVLSKLGKIEQTTQALDSAKEHLIKKDQKMALLFTPAFDKTALNPGYIKSYLPGVRENGGQYTHAACWLTMAFAQSKRSDEALDLLRMISPISHSLDKEEALLYQAEPYSIAADIYWNPSHVGRGGWSWYTGSSGLYYRAVVESLLGIHHHGNELHINPSLGKDLTEYEFTYRYGSSTYNVSVSKTGKSALYIDGEFIKEELVLPLKDENRTVTVKIEVP